MPSTSEASEATDSSGGEPESTTEEEEYDDAEAFQALSAQLSSMTKTLEVMELEVESLRQDNLRYNPELKEGLFAAIRQNDARGKQFEEFLRPVIEAINRHEDFESDCQNVQDEKEDEDNTLNNFQNLSLVSVSSQSLSQRRKSELMICLEKLILQDEKMVEEFEKLKKKCESDHLNCNIAKSVGTPVAAIGTVMSVVGLVAALPTAGASLLLTWGGASAAILGGATNAGTEITKKKLLNTVKTKIEKHWNARDKLQDEYQDKMEIFNEIVDEVLRSGSMSTISEAQALVYVLTELGGVSLTSVAKYMRKIRTLIHELNTGEKTSCVGKLKKSVGKAKIAGNVGLAVGRGVAKVVGSELSGLTKVFGTQGAKLGGEIGGKVLARTTIVLGVVFVAVDIGFLVNDWLSDAEYVKEISEQIEQVENELKCLNMEKYKLESYASSFGRNGPAQLRK